MNLIHQNIKWIMLVSGIITCSMIYAVIAPQAALVMTFGIGINGTGLVDVVVRSWGVLITLVGAMLVYGAFNPASRPLVAAVAAISKLAYVCFIVVFASAYLPKAAWVVGFDSVVGMVLGLFWLTHFSRSK